MTDDDIRRIQGEHLVMIGSREAIIEGAIKAARAIIAQARAELIAEINAAVCTIKVPKDFARRDAEYFKAGCRSVVVVLPKA